MPVADVKQMRRGTLAAGQAGAALIGKAILVVNTIADAGGPMRLGDVAQAAGLPRSTAHRILSALCDGGFVRLDDGVGAYRLGYRLFDIARRAWDDLDLRALAGPQLDRLRDATGEMAVLAARAGDGMAVLDRRGSPHALRVDLGGGSQRSLPASAMGRAILSWLPAGQRGHAGLEDELDLAKARAYALDDEQHSPGVRGVAAAVLDDRGHPIAALAVYGPALRLPDEVLHDIALDVVDAARRVTHAAGYQDYSLAPAPRPAGAPEPSVQEVGADRSLLGESPLWDAKGARLWSIDILGPALCRYDPATGQQARWPMPALTGAIAPSRDGGVVVALGRALVAFDATAAHPAQVADLQAIGTGSRVNDGACDALGRFWFGTMDLGVRSGAGALWRVGECGPPVRVLDRLTLPNGLGWSPDGARMYLTDTAERTIWTTRFDAAAGTLGRLEPFARFGAEDGRPNGLAVDAEGGVWSVLSDGWTIVRLDPGGHVVRRLVLPVPRPTNCAFGGPGLSVLYVTSASMRLPAELRRQAQASGRLFRLEPGVAGLPAQPFGTAR